MSLATWYATQYSTWNRTRRLQQPQYLARTNTNTSRVATAMAQNAQTAASPTGEFPLPAPAAQSKDKKASDPLFGPNIGPCSAGPGWTTSASRKKLITDDLTPEVLTSWIEKSKQSSQPTTTLQALVNLKRPTLRLSPLNTVPEDSQSPQEFRLQHLHGLEFEYDCDAPKCGIYVHLVLSKSHPEAVSVPSATSQAQILVFETVVPGGFGKKLTLEDGAVLELGRYDHVPQVPGPPSPSSEDPGKSESTPAVATTATVTLAPPQDSNASHRHSRRLFNFRKRTSARSAAGPALAVVDADPNAAHDTKKDKDKEDEEGVRVLIRLAALDEQGTELASPNEQTTFLHVVRVDSKSQEPAGEDNDAEDKRPWVVKVVKREATIGPHTFQLHEIYGLTASANHQSTTTTTEAHTYPPQAAADEEDPSSECLLCLSSPREVMLIPCRHLVACKECALNMVEFGAGGNISHALEPVVPAPAVTAPTTSEPNETTTGGADAPVITPMAAYSPTGGTTGGTTTVAPVTNTRRKRKAKGWFCPVCRQPYTSLLRITTAAPPPADKEEGTSDGDDGQSHRAVAGTDAATVAGEGEGRSGGGGGGGLLSGAFGRPGFLRGISLGRNAQAPAPPGDVESQAGMTRVGA